MRRGLGTLYDDDRHDDDGDGEYDGDDDGDDDDDPTHLCNKSYILHRARARPVQGPYTARTGPIVNYHRAHAFFASEEQVENRSTSRV